MNGTTICYKHKKGHCLNQNDRMTVFVFESLASLFHKAAMSSTIKKVTHMVTNTNREHSLYQRDREQIISLLEAICK
jgi:hypothetical protein